MERLTVDIALTIARKEIVLIERTKAPFMDKLVLPGGHVEPGESIAEACAREALEEIGFAVSPLDLIYLMALDRPGADPRPGHRTSHVFTVDVASREQLATLAPATDARAIHIRPLDSIRPDEMGFDHMDVIAALMARHGG